MRDRINAQQKREGALSNERMGRIKIVMDLDYGKRANRHQAAESEKTKKMSNINKI
jgi:hypothetical protein